MKTIKIKVGGMGCRHCVKAVEQALQKLAGVESVRVDLDSGIAELVYDDSLFDLLKAGEAITEEGYVYLGVLE